MSFDERRVADVTVLNCYGQLAYTAGVELKRRILALCESDPARVVLNLERVTYVDSSGLGAVVDAFIKVRKQGGSLRLVNPSDRARHLLEITSIAPLFETFACETDAVASFNRDRTTKTIPKDS
jgi:anti-sigma B factor antagonist